MVFGKVVLWLSLAYLFYVEVGYLLLLGILSTLIPKNRRNLTNSNPSISVILAAHNEEEAIAPRLENILAQDYPTDKLQIIVASDNSHDHTDEIVKSYSDRGVILHRSNQHGGKIAAIRGAEPLFTGDVVVFTDADSHFNPGALQALTRHFSDSQVGAVSGRETRPPAGSGGKGEGLYNRIETLVKRLESRVGSQVLLHGGIFAIRQDLLPYIPDHLTHDAVVPVKLALAGLRTAYEPQAVSEEAYDLDTSQDFQRRIRTVIQAYQSYLYDKDGLNPMKTGFFALQVISHRFMRWYLLPVLVVALVANLLLIGHSNLYLALAVIQIFCYALALLGFILDRLGYRPAVFYFPFYFIYIHLAAFIALTNSWRGKTVATWHTAPRSSVLETES